MHSTLLLGLSAFVGNALAAFFDPANNPLPEFIVTFDPATGQNIQNRYTVQTSEYYGLEYTSRVTMPFNYSGNARVINDGKGFAGTCGIILIKSWDITGALPANSPPPNSTYKAIALSAGRCWIDVSLQTYNFLYMKPNTFTTQIELNHYRELRGLQNVPVTVNKILFSSMNGIDVAVLELDQTAQSFQDQGFEFYPISDFVPADGSNHAIRAIVQYEGGGKFSTTLSHYMRYTTNSKFIAAFNYTSTYGPKNLYGFNHTCTLLGSGSAIFTSTDRKLIGMGTESTISLTHNQATFLKPLIPCFNSVTHGFDLRPEACLKDMKLHIWETRNERVVGFKFLTRQIPSTKPPIFLSTYYDSNTQSTEWAKLVESSGQTVEPNNLEAEGVRIASDASRLFGTPLVSVIVGLVTLFLL